MNKKQYYTKEIVIHSHITDVLDEYHKLAYDQVACNNCKEELLHAGNNECMQTWIETEFGNYCLRCFKFTLVLDYLERNLRKKLLKELKL